MHSLILLFNLFQVLFQNFMDEKKFNFVSNLINLDLWEILSLSKLLIQINTICLQAYLEVI